MLHKSEEKIKECLKAGDVVRHKANPFIKMIVTEFKGGIATVEFWSDDHCSFEIHSFKEVVLEKEEQ